MLFVERLPKEKTNGGDDEEQFFRREKERIVSTTSRVRRCDPQWRGVRVSRACVLVAVCPASRRTVVHREAQEAVMRRRELASDVIDLLTRGAIVAHDRVLAVKDRLLGMSELELYGLRSNIATGYVGPDSIAILQQLGMPMMQEVRHAA